MKRLLITAGPTREPIDAVRFISNRSSGRMGIALAHAGAAAGHDVTLLLGPTALAPPDGVVLKRFETGDDLRRLLDDHHEAMDALLMAAAVCDYRPRRQHTGKRRTTKGEAWQLNLQATEDLVAEVARSRAPHQRVVAFALENPGDLDTRAREKLSRKQVDAIVANPLRTMDAETIEPVWMTHEGRQAAPGIMQKEDAAAWIIAQLEALW